MALQNNPKHALEMAHLKLVMPCELRVVHGSSSFHLLGFRRV